MNEKMAYRGDAVIIGGGLAGIACALELLDAGRSVILLDRDRPDNFGGLAAKSFGGIFMVNTPQQRRLGIRDTEELALADWESFAEYSRDDLWPRRWAEKYVHESRAEIFDWLRSGGIKFIPVVQWVERGLFVPGNSLPRFHIVWGAGRELMRSLIGRLIEHPRKDRFTVYFNHRVTDFLRESGTVRGCRGVNEKSGRDFVARGDATIVASGGVGGDLKRMRKNWFPAWGAPPDIILNGAHDHADGRLHDAVRRIKGRVGRLDRMWNYAAGVHHPDPRRPDDGLSLVPPRSALWVNCQGKRIGHPPLITGFDTSYLVEQVCRQPGKFSWQIMNRRIARRELAVSGSEFNQAIRDKKPLAFLKTILFGNPGLVAHFTEHCPDFVAAGNLEELVVRINEINLGHRMDGRLLEREIRRYDEGLKRGAAFFNDDQIRRLEHMRHYRGDRLRTCAYQPILDPKAGPLIAVRLFILSRKSLGGIETDLECRVQNGRGEPISGLFAAGEAAGFGGGGIHGLRSLEGTFLGGCILTGRTAGRAIADAWGERGKRGRRQG